MQHNIFAQIREEARNYYDNEVEIVPGYSFNQYDTIKKCHLYSASRFVNNSLYCGRKKVFFNIVNNPCEVATKFLNFDTKDIRLLPLNAKSEIGTFLFQKELKVWLKNNNLDIKLNKIAEKGPKYGTVVVRKTKKGAKIVDLRKLVSDPTVDYIKDSPYVSEEFNYTPSQLRKQAKESGWGSEEVEKAIKHFETMAPKESYLDEQGQSHQSVNPYIKVWQRFGEVPEKWLKGDMSLPTVMDKYVKSMYVVAGGFFDEKVNPETSEKYYDEGIVLFKSRWRKEWPLLDFHYRKIEGRWLGMGVIEELFIPQERVNELANQKRIAMELSTKHIYQTSDPSIIRSILNDLEDGSVLVTSPNGQLTPLANEERNLAAFGTEETRWGDLAKSLSFAYDAAGGKPLPSSTPATNAVIQDRNTASIFKWKRENLGVVYQEFFTEWVLPQCVKELSTEHVMMFTGTNDEFMKIDKLISKSLARETAMKTLLSGKAVSPEEYAGMQEDVLRQLKGMGAKRWIKAKKDLYKNLDMQFDIIITNEQEDLQVSSENILNSLAAMSKDPEMLTNPLKKVLFKQYLEKIGVSPAQIELAEAQEAEMKEMQGGLAPQGGQPGMGNPPGRGIGQLMQQKAPQGQNEPQGGVAGGIPPAPQLPPQMQNLQ